MAIQMMMIASVAPKNATEQRLKEGHRLWAHGLQKVEQRNQFAAQYICPSLHFQYLVRTQEGPEDVSLDLDLEKMQFMARDSLLPSMDQAQFQGCPTTEAVYKPNHRQATRALKEEYEYADAPELYRMMNNLRKQCQQDDTKEAYAPGAFDTLLLFYDNRARTPGNIPGYHETMPHH